MYQQSEENENAHIPFALSRWTRASRSAAHADIILRPVARASVALIEPAAATMSLTGKIMPDFHVKVLPADGGAPERVSAFSLVHGTPTVIHFYNSG